MPACPWLRPVGSQAVRTALAFALLRRAMTLRSMYPRWLLGPGSSPIGSQRNDILPMTSLTFWQTEENSVHIEPPCFHGDCKNSIQLCTCKICYQFEARQTTARSNSRHRCR